MNFYLDNGLLRLAQQIAQDQKDLYAIEELQQKAKLQSSENTVLRHDFSEGSTDNQMHAHGQYCDSEGVCRDHGNNIIPNSAVSTATTALVGAATLMFALF